MVTVNSISGGKTSAYIAANFPADHNVFALVTVIDKRLKFPDDKVRKIVSDKIGKDFIGTLEDDEIIFTILDLEQFLGQKIQWVAGPYFEEILTGKNGKTFLPQHDKRFCTTKLKVNPIKKWWLSEIGEMVNMRIGFRVNETRRAKSMIKKLNSEGVEVDRLKIATRISDRKAVKKNFAWRVPSFPLIENGINKADVEKFWLGKPVRFAWMNNCAGCFMTNPFYIARQSQRNPEKIDWFLRQEAKSLKDYGRGWRSDRTPYSKIIEKGKQATLFDDYFSECDSGFCGI
jgi:hypothetical protein